MTVAGAERFWQPLPDYARRTERVVIEHGEVSHAEVSCEKHSPVHMSAELKFFRVKMNPELK